MWIIRFTGRRAVLEQFSSGGELNNQALEKSGGRAIDERMKAFLLQLFAAAADGASVHLGHGLEEGGIKFDRVVGFRESEFGHGRIELKLQALQENGMVDVAFGATPTENAISENQLHALGFTVDAAIEGVQGLKDFHRGASRLFVFGPFFAHHFPTLPSGHPGRFIGEVGDVRFAFLTRFIPGSTNGRLF